MKTHSKTRTFCDSSSVDKELNDSDFVRVISQFYSAIGQEQVIVI